MKFSEALDNYLAAKRELNNLVGQRPQNMGLILDAEANVTRRAADLDGMFLAQEQVRSSSVAQVAFPQSVDPEHYEVTTKVTPAISDIDRAVAQRMKELREDWHCTEEDIAEVADLSASTIRRIEDVDDGMTITMETARKIMPYVGMCACCGQDINAGVVRGPKAEK